MTFFNSIKKTLLAINIIYIIIGYLLMVKGSACVELVVTILGLALMIAGLIEIIRYFFIKIDDRFKRNDFILGIFMMVLAIVIIICRYSISDIATVTLGVAIIVSGALKMQDAIDSKKFGKNHFGLYLTLMIICIAFGALVIFNFFYSFSVKILYASAGLGMLFAGLTDLISNIYLAILRTKYEKSKEAQEVTTTNVEPKPEEIKEKPVEKEEIKEAKFTPIDADVPKTENVEVSDTSTDK